eukprot:COSAG01_NODE_41914_length_445_cov_8.135838_1_plen_107_part_00
MELFHYGLRWRLDEENGRFNMLPAALSVYSQFIMLATRAIMKHSFGPAFRRPRLTITNSEPMLPANKKEVRINLPIPDLYFSQSAAAAAHRFVTLLISSVTNRWPY